MLPPSLEELLKSLIRLHELLHIKKYPWWYLNLSFPETSELVRGGKRKNAHLLGGLMLSTTPAAHFTSAQQRGA